MPALGFVQSDVSWGKSASSTTGHAEITGQCHARNAQPDRRFTCRCEGDGIRVRRTR